MTDWELIIILAIMCTICFATGFILYAMLCAGGRVEKEETIQQLTNACASAYDYFNNQTVLTDDEESLLGTLETAIQQAKEKNK